MSVCALRQPVFEKDNFSVPPRDQTCVLSVLGECWTPLKRHVRKLNAFLDQFLQTVLEITVL